MIRPRYTLKLARTKLRSKRGILFASIIVASLLFATLIACIVVFTGAEKSSTNFIKKANNDHYLVKVSPVIPEAEIRFSHELTLDEIHEIDLFERQYYSNIRAKYEKLGLDYNESIEIPALTPAAWKSTALPEDQRVSVNWQSPVIRAMLDVKYADYARTATNKISDLQAVGEKYGAEGYYVQRPSGVPGIPTLSLIQNHKENFGDTEMNFGDSSVYGYYINAIHNGQYSFEDTLLLDRYLLIKDTTDLKGIPVIVSAQEVASLFGKDYGIGQEPENETKKTAWLKDIQTKLNGFTYQACYRNSTERSMLDKIQRDYAEITNNRDNEDYAQPSLLYDYPTSACGDIVTKTDQRTETDKKTEEDEIIVQKKLGEYVAPEHRILTFQIVGITNARPHTAYNSSIKNYIKSLITVDNSSMSAVIPLQMYDSLSESMKFDDLVMNNAALGNIATSDFATRILEFSSIDDARSFMNNETCPSSDTGCNKKFVADPYGSNYLIFDEINKLFVRILSVAFPIMLGLAMVIIWFTISRIMTENRKETSVYRAMGAKRNDIVAIYLTYVLLVALRIVLISVVLGLAAAYVVDYFYGSELSNVAVSSFGTITGELRYSLFDPSSVLLWWVIGLIFVISVAASIPALIHNVLRSPAEDIRDE